MFTGLSVRQLCKLVTAVHRHGGPQIADGRPGRQWRLDLADRVLLVAVYYRTNLTVRQLAPLFGCSGSPQPAPTGSSTGSVRTWRWPRPAGIWLPQGVMHGAVLTVTAVFVVFSWVLATPVVAAFAGVLRRGD